MAIKRYTAIADNTITNAYKSDLSTRGSGSNMGAADTVEIFSLYGQASGTSGLSSELSRAILKFPIAGMQTDRSASIIPVSGNVSWYLRLFNAPHAETTPRNYHMAVSALERAWDEGDGLDMESYSDKGYPLGSGSNWIYARQDKKWQATGADFDPTDASGTYTQYFDTGDEDLEIDVTPLVESWMHDKNSAFARRFDHGIIVYLSGNYEAYYSGSVKARGGQLKTGSEGEEIHNTNGAKRSYYTKKFFARSSEFFFKRPVLEARWNSAKKDNRGNFFYSSSLAPAEDNLNTLYLYNYIRGQLRNIPSLEKTGGKIYVSLFSGTNPDQTISQQQLHLAAGGDVVAALDFNATGGLVSTGIYSCSICLTAAVSPHTQIYDVWHDGAGPSYAATQFFTGSIYPEKIEASEFNPTNKYYTSITNLRPTYYTDETARFRLYVRPRNWNPNIYTRAVSTIESNMIESGAYQVYRVADNRTVVDFGTASYASTLGRGEGLHTQMSYDISGNYFDLDMSMLEPGYSYGLRFAYYDGAISSWQEQREYFKFRVEKTREFN